MIARGLVGIVRDLDSGRPSRDTGRAADAYVALVQAVEAAEMERVTQAAALVRGTESVRVRGVVVEANALDTFRQYASRPLVAELDRLLSEPARSSVERVRELMIRDPASVPEANVAGAVAGRVRDAHPRAASPGSARPPASWRRRRRRISMRHGPAPAREAAASLGVLMLVAGLGLVLRRSITRPLGEVSEAARRLSAGQLASGVSYAGRDEIGEVAAAFRDLHVTAERLAEEIRAMNAAVEDNRLDHRADVAALEGRWAELMGGINDTMAAFAELQGRRERAERHADRIFELSHDLLCIAGFDGYFKRVNPAFARLLGYPTETMLSRPTREFVHPDDRAAPRRASRAAGGRRARPVRAATALQRRLGAPRRVERAVRAARSAWSTASAATSPKAGAPPTSRPRCAAWRRWWPRACRRRRSSPRSPARCGRCSRPPRRASCASSPMARSPFWARRRTDPARRTRTSPPRSPARAARPAADGAVGAPIVVEDRLWGVVAVSESAESLPPGAEERLARFTELVATAIANAESRAEVAASRARVVTAGDEERRRVVRDLHDGGAAAAGAHDHDAGARLRGRSQTVTRGRRRSWPRRSSTRGRRTSSCASCRTGSSRRPSRGAACARAWRRSSRGCR